MNIFKYVCMQSKQRGKTWTYCTGQLNIWSGCMWPLNPNEFEVPDLDFKLKGATAGK